MYEITGARMIGPDVKRFDIHAPRIAAKQQPGQFVILRLHETGERIPLTIAGSDPENGTITLVVQGIGKTTRLLNQLEAGDELRDLVGPLGKASEVERYGRVVVVGGGVGTAIALPVAKALKAAGNHVAAIVGARHQGLLILLDEMREASNELHIMTDDGSAGDKGFVTGRLQELIDAPEGVDYVMAIGPLPMMAAVSEVTRARGIRTVVSLNPLEDNRPDSVGVALNDIEIRLGEDDELLVKGPCNTPGYWNNAEATARVLDADGWFHTGDQARIDGRHIYITGRLKDILVLSNGEKVPPADMEMAIALDPLVEQVLVIGEGRSYLTALVVLTAEQWPALAARFALDPDRSESLDDQRLHKEVLQRVRESLSDFPGYAKIRRVALSLEPWSIDNGLLTPTMKTRRAQVVARYQGQVTAMYDLDGG